MRKLGLEAALVLGRQGRKERNAVLRAVQAGLVHVVIGTHALIQEKIAYKDLGLVVIDEQHRFGVKQRAMLREKGRSPEVLVMTATPIPRTLAMTVHGDLDVSVIDELPPGRKPVETKWSRTKREQDETWEAVRHQIQQGRQCYVVYPLIEDSDAEDFAHVKSATERHEWLSTEVFPDYQVALLHGQMTPQDKDAIMERFRKGEIHVLVSTTVIEVGVDVPNASIMVIENAERFGLAQLHQLRGRVGRGAYQSYCYLMSDSRGEATAQRLGIMEATNDGFVIAEQDLKLRGPGEFLGTRQSGMPDMLLANLVEDTRLLERARETALRVISADPTLDQRPLLKQDLFRYFKANLSFLEVG
jgi:ATP-dependent DNA helicase RecG